MILFGNLDDINIFDNSVDGYNSAFRYLAFSKSSNAHEEGAVLGVRKDNWGRRKLGDRVANLLSFMVIYTYLHRGPTQVIKIISSVSI